MYICIFIFINARFGAARCQRYAYVSIRQHTAYICIYTYMYMYIYLLYMYIYIWCMQVRLAYGMRNTADVC